MPNYLTETDWKAVLNKPKNLGLRAQGTGVSDKLRTYERENQTFTNTRNLHNATEALKALQALKQHVDTEKTKHKAFTEATDYLQHISTEAGTREVALIKDVNLLGSVDLIKDVIKRATEQIKTIKTYEEFTDMDTHSVLQKVRSVGASCAKVPALAKFGSQAGDFTKEKAITKENWQNVQYAVAKWMIQVKAAVEKL